VLLRLHKAVIALVHHRHHWLPTVAVGSLDDHRRIPRHRHRAHVVPVGPVALEPRDLGETASGAVEPIDRPAMNPGFSIRYMGAPRRGARRARTVGCAREDGGDGDPENSTETDATTASAPRLMPRAPRVPGHSLRASASLLVDDVTPTADGCEGICAAGARQTRIRRGSPRPRRPSAGWGPTGCRGPWSGRPSR